jgi:hypothetical protein
LLEKTITLLQNVRNNKHKTSIKFTYVCLSIVVSFYTNCMFWVCFILEKNCNVKHILLALYIKFVIENKESYIFINNFLQNTQEFKREEVA